MNILKALFGIFRQRGLVTTVRENRPLAGFALAAVLFSIAGGTLYGFAMGIGLGIDTAVKDALKVGLIVALGVLLSAPIFWVAYRLLGREERLGQVAAVPLTLVATVSIVLAITAPIVFFLSVLAGFSPEAVYIHVVIVDLALLVGLYLAGMLIHHTSTDRKGLVIPNVVGFLMMGVILVVLISFFSPFLSLWPTFSVGTDRLKDGLGIGVAEKVDRALAAAAAADRVTYRFQATNDNGDLVRDYTVTRVGDDYLVQVHLHAVPGETWRTERRIWLLEGEAHTDFDEGRVARVDRADLGGLLDAALPEAAFRLAPEFSAASWRAYESGGHYNATGTSETAQQATLVLDATTGRLSGLTVGGAGRGLHAEVRVRDVAPAEFDRAEIEAMLNQALVVGSVDRSDASMRDYVQEETLFVVRYPRDWRAGTWSSSQRRVGFTTSCGAQEGCPALTAAVYDLAEGKGARQYADDLGASLALQPAYREIEVHTTSIGDETVGVVEYLYDRPVQGEIETTRHVEFIFVGQAGRYHLDFAALDARFETWRGLFEEMAGSFVYLGVDLS